VCFFECSLYRYIQVDVYGYAVFHKSWSKLEEQGTKYYHDGNTAAGLCRLNQVDP
jgi:hypothetical protein